MEPIRIAVKWRTAAGLARGLEQAAPEHGRLLAGERQIALSARVERDADRVTIGAAVSNRGGEALQLDQVAVTVPTGFAESAPARFFKHGYQSWSASYPVTVGTAAAPASKAPRIARLMHQSEASRALDVPETATSELFTIIQSVSAPPVLAGFVRAASQLTTLTVPSAARIVARALFDGVTLAPGQTREMEPLVVMGGADAAHLAHRWASLLGRNMNARLSAKYQRGWCSWYHYFHRVTEQDLRSNLSALAAMRDEFPLEIVQLDDGYQAALGDWDVTNANFPSGLKRLADEIRAAGFQPGLWTAPFLAARDSELMRAHPGWFILHESGAPLRAGYNPNWTRDPGGYAYALDPTNPLVTEHLARLFRRLAGEFGYTYLKLDFLYAAAAEGQRHDRRMTRAETLARGLAAIREGAGEAAFLLGCGCPLGAAVGIVDGMRIGPDVAPEWNGGAGEFGRPSTASAIDAIVARSFMHRRLWLNDPDCLMLRAADTRLSAEERGALAAAVAASGGMLLISDDMALLDARAGALLRAAAKLGDEVDSGSGAEPALALDLMAAGPLRCLIRVAPGGALVMVLNRSEREMSFYPSALGLSGGSFALESLDGAAVPAKLASPGPGKILEPGASIDLPPHCARLLRWRR